MADWNAYEARIRDKALVDAIAAVRPCSSVAADLIEQLRAKHSASAVTQASQTAVASRCTASQWEPPAEQLPIPPRQHSGMHYPFDDMVVGDHFDRPRDRGVTENNSDRRQKSIMAAAKAWRKRRGSDAQFTTRLIDDNIVRCWRVS